MPHKKQEKIGVILALSSAVIGGLFPVFINRGAHSIPPLTFAAISTLLASVGALAYLVLQNKTAELKKKGIYYNILLITLFIVIIPYILFFIGTSKTSGTNSSTLLLSEIIFTMFFTHFYGEKTTIYKILGAGGILIGALFILFNGQCKLNIGDLLIIASTFTYPIGNLYAKRALHTISPATILFVRFLLGGIFIFFLSLIFEPQANIPNIINYHWPLILFSGLILFGVGKILGYEAFRRLDISKAISLMMTFPIFSLLILVVIFKETISVYQWAGAGIMMIGVYFAIKRLSVDSATTKYSNQL